MIKTNHYSLFFSHVFFMTSLDLDMSNPLLLSVSHPRRECHPTLLLWLLVLSFLIKYHFFLSSSKYDYMPRLKLRFPQFLIMDTHQILISRACITPTFFITMSKTPIVSLKVHLVTQGNLGIPVTTLSWVFFEDRTAGRQSFLFEEAV